MKPKMLLIVVVILLFVVGCSETGFEKRTTVMPGSMTIGYMQEKYRSDHHAWDGISISATWVFE